MKKLITAGLVALIALPAVAADPYAHLDEWGDACYYGGNYINFEISKIEGRSWSVYDDDQYHWHTVKEQFIRVDHAEIKYVPTDHDVDRGAYTQHEQWDARDECQENEKDVAYTIEDVVDHNGQIGYYDVYDRDNSSAPVQKNRIKDLINDFVKDVRWSSSDWNIKDFDNGVFDDPAEIFEGRYLDNLPDWLKP